MGLHSHSEPICAQKTLCVSTETLKSCWAEAEFSFVSWIMACLMMLALLLSWKLHLGPNLSWIGIVAFLYTWVLLLLRLDQFAEALGKSPARSVYVWQLIPLIGPCISFWKLYGIYQKTIYQDTSTY